MASHVYMVTAVTHERHSIFMDFHVGRILVRELMRSDAFEYTDTLAFVVMPDHMHWLFILRAHISLSDVIGAVKRHFARQINNLLLSPGQPVWQRGYHDHALRRDEDIISVARYIIANPLRAGLVTRVGGYPLWDAVWL